MYAARAIGDTVRGFHLVSNSRNVSGGSMKRLVLGLVMAGGLAFLTTPMANAGVLGECGKSYAFQVHGAEPSSSNDAALQYIVGIGQITFNAGGTSGTDGCTVGHLELIYNDGGSQFNAGP